MKKIISIIFLLCFWGCDIPGVLQIENASDSDISYIVYKVDENGKEERVELEVSNEQKRKDIVFGFGQFWTESRIKEYLRDISKVKIISKNDSLTITDKTALYNYFKKRRRGLFKNIIKIKVE